MAVSRNTNEIAWQAAPPAAVNEDAMYIGVWSALTGGSFLFGVQISNNPDALALGEVYYIASNGLAITQTAATNEAEASAQDALRGRLGGVGTVNRFYAIHTGDPGTNGANQASLDRVSLAHTGFTYTDT